MCVPRGAEWWEVGVCEVLGDVGSTRRNREIARRHVWGM